MGVFRGGNTLRQFLGTRVLTWRPKSATRRGGQRLPRRGEKRLYVALRDVWLYLEWHAWKGYYPVALVDGSDPLHPTIEHWGYPRERMAIKRRSAAPENMVLPALSSDSMIMKKIPLVMEFLTATAYADGLQRTPGYYTVRNRLVEFEATLYDPDGGVRLVVRHREYDRMWFAVEALLGAEDAPWEPDRYLMEQAAKKPKKKR